MPSGFDAGLCLVHKLGLDFMPDSLIFLLAIRALPQVRSFTRDARLGAVVHAHIKTVHSVREAYITDLLRVEVLSALISEVVQCIPAFHLCDLVRFSLFRGPSLRSMRISG